MTFFGLHLRFAASAPTPPKKKSSRATGRKWIANQPTPLQLNRTESKTIEWEIINTFHKTQINIF